ncbi:hypothetical protein ROZALSC1DRAFT_27214 [Rozella allomycis CSF55]|uniref:Protein kinase domain-containing protein n=1 Tax=Rozella allomycis (strain CSF55) TaxID=988480 RepID=A0A4V1J0F4_ROZAC|nr:hypothetical protein ROZALSC1DRAFT_27214 [Rozella allomycis CSF55]
MSKSSIELRSSTSSLASFMTNRRSSRKIDSLYSESRNCSCLIQDYELLHPIGVDEMAYIYACKFLPTKQNVAIRYTDLSALPDYEVIEEANMFRHSNLLPFYTSFVENERLWTIVYPMEGDNCDENSSVFTKQDSVGSSRAQTPSIEISEAI